MGSVSERLAILASPLGINLPEAYLAFMENRPGRGIQIRHLCNPLDPLYEWWPESVEFLEQDIYRGRWHKVELNAHYMKATVESWSVDDHSVSAPGEPPFGSGRLSHGFWIGEVDGDCVFIDYQTGGVYAWLEHEGQVEQWAPSFADFVAHGQRTGRCAEPSAAADGGA